MSEKQKLPHAFPCTESERRVVELLRGDPNWCEAEPVTGPITQSLFLQSFPRGYMTPEDVENDVRRIDDLAHHRVPHGGRDVAGYAVESLFRDVLMSIAFGAPGARKLAIRALKVDELDFDR